MILNPKETTVAYRCPSCGATVISLIGAFSLSADMIRLKCPCGESMLTAVYTKDEKVRLSVPCFLCPKPHTFQLSAQLFFSTEQMSFPCPYSGVDICFIGKKENVDKSIEASNQELNALLNGADFTALTDPRPENDLFNDPQILDIVMYVINELQAEGEICCRCPEGEHGEYMIDILEDHVHLACKKCGASTDIPADSIVSANAFLHCTHIDLV